MKVLVTGAGALLGQGIIKSLTRSSLAVEIVAVDPSPYAAGLYWTQGHALVPMAADPAYLSRFEELLSKERPEAVLIGTDVELGVLAGKREEFERRYSTTIVVSSPQVVSIADDKYLTFDFLKERGFPVPESVLPGFEETLINKVGFPLVVKPRIGARSIGVSVVQNRTELQRAVENLKFPVIQECVGTEDGEYTAGTLTFSGRCEASIVMRRDLKDGNTYRAFVEEFPELNGQIARLAEALGAFGPANFQFRLDGKVAKVFEINARFSGTTPLRMLAGFNEVEMVLRRVLLGERICTPSLRPMTILRYWAEQVVPVNESLVK